MGLRASPTQNFAAGPVRLLLGDVVRHHRAALGTALLLSVAVALAEGFGLLALVPILAFAADPGSAAQLPFLAPAFRTIAPDQRLAAALAAFLGLMALRSLLILARGRAEAGLDADYQAGLRLRVLAAVADRGWRFASAAGPAGIQASLHNDIPRVAAAVRLLIHLIVTAALVLVQAGLALLLSWRMTLVALLLLLVVAPAGLIFIRRSFASGRAIAERLDESSRSGMRLQAELKSALAQGSVPRLLAHYRAALGRLARDLKRYGRDQAAASALFGILAALAAAALVWSAATLLDLALPVTLGMLLLFARLNAPVQGLISAGNALAAHAPSFAALRDRLGPLDWPAEEGEAAEPLDWRRLELAGVALDHDGRRVLDGIDLNLAAGEWLALTGASGAGKTSLIDVIAGLYRPDAGRMLVDGAPLDGEQLRRWQAGLAYVAQDELLLDGTVAEQLDGADALLTAVGLAVDPATPVGRLSGGERQRLAIARALARRPRLLILDEATAALDLAAEAELIGRLRSLQPRPAALLVSHRPQTIAHCDRSLNLVSRHSADGV